MTHDEDQRASVSSAIALVRIRPAIYRPAKTPGPVFRIAVAINSRVIDGAISGATRGRVLAVRRSVQLEIRIVVA